MPCGHTADYSSKVYKSLNKAEALIQLLEVQDCGSVGGFDTNQSGHDSLYERFLYLGRKYNQLSGIKKNCYFTPLKLKKYFDAVKGLRETFNKG